MQKSKKVSYRHFAITELINTHTIENQQQLLDLLKSEFQVETNQSIISRDLVDLGVVRQHYKDKIIYEMPDTSADREIVRLGVKSIVHNEATIVVNTLRGFAPIIGDYIDQKDDPEILATVAGENVVFVAPKSIKNIESVYEKICQALFYKQEEPEQTKRPASKKSGKTKVKKTRK